jgi:hypothetical protein
MLGFFDTHIYEENLHSPRNFPGKGRFSMTLTDAADYFSRYLSGHRYLFIVFFVLNPCVYSFD